MESYNKNHDLNRDYLHDSNCCHYETNYGKTYGLNKEYKCINDHNCCKSYGFTPMFRVPTVTKTTCTTTHHVDDPNYIRKRSKSPVDKLKHDPHHKNLNEKYEKNHEKIDPNYVRKMSSNSSFSSTSRSLSKSPSKEKHLNKEEKMDSNRRRIRDLLKFNGNDRCFDCQNYNPSWVDLTFAVFLCVDCAKQHKLEFPNSHDRIRSIDVNDFSWNEISLLKVGGNDTFRHFLSMYELDSRGKSFTNVYLYSCVIYYIKNIVALSKKKKFKKQRPSREEGLKPVHYNDIEGAWGLMSKLKSRVKGMFGVKGKEEKIADEKMCNETKGVNMGVNNITSTHNPNYNINSTH